MTRETPSDATLLEPQPDFSLVLGGPFYQLFLRGRSPRAPLDHLHRRILALTLLAWAPLFVLTAIAGQLVHGVEVPFLFDLDVLVRFLGSVPLMVAAEWLVHQRLRVTVQQFLERGLIAPEDRPRFRELIAGAMRLRNSMVIEAILLVIAAPVGHWFWRSHMVLQTGTWYTMPEDHRRLSAAGWWYVWASLPILRFLALRWYFRLAIWYRFLWQVAKLPLRLNALHPDRSGGLGFLAGSVFTFSPLLLAHAVLLSGAVGNRIWHEGAVLKDFQLPIAGVVVFLVLLMLAPLTFFLFKLAAVKRQGAREYGVLASRYVSDFRQRWIEDHPSDPGALLGSADIQSLADLAGAYDVVREMRLVPFGKETVLRLAILIALPLAPLSLTVIPLEEMLSRIMAIFL